MLGHTGFVASTRFYARVTTPSSGCNLTTETRYMATSTHLAELEQRHRMLEDELTEALQHPSTDDLALRELKRRKLQLKDEIARLTRSGSVH